MGQLNWLLQLTGISHCHLTEKAMLTPAKFEITY